MASILNKCHICESDTSEKLKVCNSCHKSPAHDSCIVNERLYIPYDDQKRKAYFCKYCQTHEMDNIKGLIKRTIEKINHDRGLGNQGSDLKSDHSEKAEFSEKNSNTLPKIQNLKITDEASPAKTINTNHNEIDFNLELSKSQKEISDASQQLSELASKGEDLKYAQERLNKALSDFTKLNKLHMASVASQPHANISSLSSKVETSTHLNIIDDFAEKCVLCAQYIVKRENSLKCKLCTSHVHVECGLNKGLVKLPISSLKGEDENTFHCLKCINLKTCRKSELMNKNAARDSIDTTQNAPNSTLNSRFVINPFSKEHLDAMFDKPNQNQSSPLDQNPRNSNTANDTIAESMNKTLQEMSSEKLRKEYKKLPLVTDEGVSWKHFYDAYQDTKDYFKPYTNAERIREAIKCDSVKQKGGENLFHKDTCNDTIEFLNSLFKDTTAHMFDKLKNLLTTKINHPHDYDSVLKYLIKALNFATLLNSLGNPHSGYHQEWMTRITDKLPFEHKNSWQKLCYEKRKLINQNGEKLFETFHDLEDYLKDVIAYVNMVKGDHLFFSTGHANDSKSSKPKNNRPHNPLNNTCADREPWSFKCWLCKKDDHIIRDCKIAKEKDGKEVFNIASKLKICVLCGREKYVKGKACTGQKSPSECKKCPGRRHWGTFCPMRKGFKSNDKNKDTSTSNNRENFNGTQLAIDYVPKQAIGFPQKPMIMPPNNTNLHTLANNSDDDGAEFVATHQFTKSQALNPDSVPWEQQSYNHNSKSFMHKASKQLEDL